VVFVARASGSPVAGDDAADAGVFTETSLPAPLDFDHTEVLADYFAYKRTGRHPLKK
jgi:8-oxo-dGTP diphosphatase